MAFFRRKGKEDEKVGSDVSEKSVKADVPKDDPVEEKASTTKKAVPKENKTEAPEEDSVKETASTPRKASYVVCTHPDGGWQVKKTGSTKAIRRFDTKAEADAYAKKVASNNGATVIRKKKDGKIQKKL